MAGRMFDYATVWREAGCPLPIPGCVLVDGYHKEWSDHTFQIYVASSANYGIPNADRQQLFLQDVEALLKSNAPNRYGTKPQARPFQTPQLRPDTEANLREGQADQDPTRRFADEL